MRRAAVAGVLVVILVGVVVSGRLSHDTATQVNFDGPVRETVVHVDAGRIDVQGVDGEGARMRRRDRAWLVGPPPATAWADGSGVRVLGVCPGWLVLRCRTDLRMEVPGEAAIDIESVSADVSLRNVAGLVRVRSGSGNVAVDGSTSRSLTLVTGSGRIEGGDVGTPRVSAESDSGSISMTLTEPPENVSLITTRGSVELTVPNGRYRVRAETNIGVARIEVETDDASQQEIFVRATLGDIHIRGVGAPPA